MSPLEAIATCREMRKIGSPWPLPLLLCLDESAGQEAMFDFVGFCFDDILDHFGTATVELKDALMMARGAFAGAIDKGLIEQTGWSLWNRRSEGGQIRAVARVLQSLNKKSREDRRGFVLNCAMAIKALDDLETTRDEVVERVIAHFSRDCTNRSTMSPESGMTRPSP